MSFVNLSHILSVPVDAESLPVADWVLAHHRAVTTTEDTNMIQTLANMADAMLWAKDKLEEYGAPFIPEAVSTLFAAYEAADSFDGEAGAITGNAGKSLAMFVARAETYARTMAIAAQTDPTPDNGAPLDLDPTGDWDDRAFHVAVTASEIWQARQHETVTRRSNSGRTNVKVTRRGVASVIGAIDGPDGCGTALAHVGARRTRTGWDALGVIRATKLLYRADEVPPMIGTDAVAWSDIIAGDASTTDVHGVARHTGDASGYLTLTSALSEALQGPERAREGRMTWQARTSLRKPARRRTDPVDDGTRLVGAHVDSERLWHGHRLVRRAPAVKRGAVRATRTVGAFRADTLDAALDAMRGAQLAAGERATFAAGDWSLTVTRGKSTRKAWSARAKRDGAEAVAVTGSVSGAACADRLARLVTP